jgi:hypothetical protein
MFGDCVNLVLVRLETVLMLVHFRDSANLEARLVHGWRLTYHGDNVSAYARSIYGLCRTYHRLRNHFG